MIKLITPKRDLYMDGDTCNPEGLFGKKGKFYEVKGYGYAGEDIMFIDERGVEHSYGVDFVDTDFWTVDLSETFMFTTAWVRSVNHTWCNHNITKDGSSDVHDWSNDYYTKLAIESILDGSWVITRFSNQVPSHPEEICHPYENWKKDIGEAKFHRCTDKCGVLLMKVDNICGFIDEGNRLFYYQKNHRGQQTYLCCKVSYSCADGWYFVRENKDSALVKESSEVLASFKVTVEESTPTPDWLVNDIGKPDLHDYVRNVNGIIASLKVPEDKEEYPEHQMMELTFKNAFEDSGKSGGEVSDGNGNTWTDKHYDFTYTLAPEDIKAGEIKIDPYFVNRMWNINSWDDTGAAFHSLKNYARICNNKNPLERDLKSLYKQVKRLCELHKVVL